MKKTQNKYINIGSYNTINNSSSKKRFITVNRLNSKFCNNNKTLKNNRRNIILSEDNNTFKPFIYKKKSQLEKSNSFYIKNRKNLSLRNDKSLIKEEKPFLLIPSYKHFDFKKNFKNYSNHKNSKKKKRLPRKCQLYLSRNKSNKNISNKNIKNTFNNNMRYSKNITKGTSNNSTGISIGNDSNKKNFHNNIQRYNCYSYDDEMTIKDEHNSECYYSKDINEDNSLLYINNKRRNDNNKKNKYINMIEKENELLKNELMKTNKKLNLLEKKIENIIEGNIFKSNTQSILTNARSRITTYKKNYLIKKCPVPTPYVQKFSKNDFFSTKHKDIKVTLKLNNRKNNEESKNNY